MVKPGVQFGRVAAKKTVLYPGVRSKGSYISNQHVAGAATRQEFTPRCYGSHWFCSGGAVLARVSSSPRLVERDLCS